MQSWIREVLRSWCSSDARSESQREWIAKLFLLWLMWLVTWKDCQQEVKGKGDAADTVIPLEHYLNIAWISIETSTVARAININDAFQVVSPLWGRHDRPYWAHLQVITSMARDSESDETFNLNWLSSNPTTMTDSDPIVEEMSQTRFKLERLIEEQLDILRLEPGFQDIYERNSLGFATNPGDLWIPVDDAQKEENRRKMEEMCAMDPTSVDEWAILVLGYLQCRSVSELALIKKVFSRMRIFFAAHGLVIYIIKFDMNELPFNVQLEINRRNLELQ